MTFTIIAPDLDASSKRETRNKPTATKPARGETRFPGIKRHADTLGVTRPHLWMVLTGERQSADLVRRYLRGKINKGERNDGALKFENLIGSPDRFEEDLNLANEARKGTPLAVTSKPKAKEETAPNLASDGQEVFSGPEAVAFFKQLCTSRP